MRSSISVALLAAPAMLFAAGNAGAQSWLASARLLPPASMSSSAALAHQRPDLLARMRFGVTCFPPNMTQEELDAVIEEFDLLPPTQLGLADERFFTDTQVWVGNGTIGSASQAAPATLTYSFPDDGTTWGLSAISSTGPNDLNAKLTTLFGAPNLDRGREYLRQSLASWRRYAALSYQEVADNNSTMDQSTTHVNTRGDIRIGGRQFGTGSFLAYNAFPSASGVAGVGGSDMCINTSFFTSSAYNSATNNFRYLRNTTAHEHGHGLGNIHTVPCNNTKLMEPFITVAFDAVQVDERRGAGKSYGDRFSGNNSAASARDFGSLTSPALMSVIERNLSTNGTAGANNSDEDWFKFTLGSAQTVAITAAPTGGSYTNGQQSSSCSGTTSTVNSSSAGNLNIELRDSAGAVVLQTAAAAGAGLNEVLNAGSLAPGTYSVRIFDVGPNANQTVQLYDMTIRIAAAFAPPKPIAGLSKRIGANLSCFFMGDINSAANEGSLTAYAWDLDGDGTFESNIAQPSRTYPSNGVYPVTLRTTDSNGMAATDTITVTVFGATTTVASATPSIGNTGTTVPVTITGTNLKNVTSAAMVAVSGSGVTVIGTPIPDALGTSVAGLSFMISGGASGGLRDITVSNADGTGTGNAIFTVNAAPPPLPGGFVMLAPADSSLLPDTTPTLSWSTSSDATGYAVSVDNDGAFGSPEYTSSGAASSAPVPLGLLNYKVTYFWTVAATNAQGSTVSTPASFLFRTPPCPGDANYDKVVTFLDITTILENYGAAYSPGQSGAGDSSNSDSVEFADITETLNFFGNSCP